jgi:pantetheine-phosphate adenylyltransferase
MKDSTRDIAINIVKSYLSFVDKAYHNMEHAKFVVDNALDLAEEEGLSDNEMKLVEISSWYHDIGHIFGNEEHEEKSAKIAKDNLEALDVNDQDILRITRAIRATNYPQDYQSDSVAQVVADADLVTVGQSYDKFYRNHTKAYHEFDLDMTPREWVIEFGIPRLESQTYMTDTAIEKYQSQIITNLKRHRDLINNGPAKVLVGGTFDMIHAGHKELLRTAFGYGNPTIGLTSDELANESRERTLKPYNERYEILNREASRISNRYNREFEIVKLTSKEDVYTSEEADIIVISPEPKTKKRVDSINKKRIDNGLDELEVIVSDEVYAYDGNRISSTRIRNNEIEPDGENIRF